MTVSSDRSFLNKQRFFLVFSLLLVAALITGLWFVNEANSKENPVAEFVAEDEYEKDVNEKFEKEAVEESVGERIVIFYEELGDGMSREALGFVRTLSYPLDEYQYSEGNAKGRFLGLKDFYESSTGKSENFGFFPIIFIKDKAYSGFSAEIREEISREVYGLEDFEAESSSENE